MADGERLPGEGATARLSRGRDALQPAADRFVRENRFTIAVVFPLVGAATLAASAELAVGVPNWLLPYFLLFGAAVMRLPLLVGVAPLVDRRAGVVLLSLAGFTYGIELVGVATGVPYGAFEYGMALGPMLGDAVPVALPLLYLPLVIDSYLLALLLSGPLADRRTVRVAGGVATLLLVDLVLDPGAVAVGFWAYDAGGAYYGVPATNYAGWLLSGSVAVIGIDLAFERSALWGRLADCEFLLDDLVSFVLLWGAINLLYGQWIAVAVAGLIGVAVARTGYLDGWVPRSSNRVSKGN